MSETASRASIRIGVDLGGTKIEAIALDREGQERFRKRVPTPVGDYTGTVRAIATLIKAASQETETLQGGTKPSVGVGIPGTISPATGLIKGANSVCLIGHALDRDIESAVGQPVRLANDADCFTLSEAADGAGRDGAIVFGVILGTGVGGGIVIDKKIVRGPNAISGEWGHNPLPWPSIDAGETPGRECYCGQRGCIETFLSGPGLSADFEAATSEKIAAPDIVERAARGDAPAKAALDRYTQRLARSLATVINLLDPSVIVLGGGLSNIERLYRDVAPLLPEFVFSDTVVTPIVPPKHGDSSGVRGAAWLWP
ncbi:MAG: ROK family protein [Rhodospirillaceae bacterium]|nr:ROK family protein [Rhodospirillaceae bacterium]